LKLRDIQWEILFIDFAEAANNTALDDRPKALDCVGVKRANNILTFGMIDDSVRIFFAEVLIAHPLIGDQQAKLVRDSFMNEAFQC
jgi:hypothetical protein